MMKKKVKSLASFFMALVMIMGFVPLQAYALSGWQDLGAPDFSADQADSVSMCIYDGTPYVAYVDHGYGNKAVVMRYDNGSWSPVGPEGGFSEGMANSTSLCVYDGTLYVAYQDGANSNKATVMNWDGDSWSPVGDTVVTSISSPKICVSDTGTPYLGFVHGSQQITVMKYADGSWANVGSDITSSTSWCYANDFSMSVDGDTPYVAYSDSSSPSKQVVVKYFNGTNWVSLGYASAGSVSGISLFADDDTPYVAYQDYANGYGATVMAYTDGSWASVGDTSFTSGSASNISLYVDNGTPYMAYTSPGNNNYATVMAYDGDSWETVGDADFTPDGAQVLSLSVDGGTPYLAFQDCAHDNKATVMKYVESAPTYTVFGTVSLDGSGVSGVLVDLYASDDDTYTNPLYSDTTDSDGNYSIDNVADGAYYAVVEADSGSYTQGVSNEITVDGDDVTSADITLEAESSGGESETVYPYYVITKGETGTGDYHVYVTENSTGSFTAFNTGADAEEGASYSSVETAMSAITDVVGSGSATLKFGLTGTDEHATGTLEIDETIDLGTAGAYVLKGRLTGSSDNTIYLNGASITIDGASIGNDGSGYTIENNANGSITMLDGTVSNPDTAIYSELSGDIMISGGTITSTGGGGTAVRIVSGNIAVSGSGTISATGDGGTAIRDDSGDITVSGGTVTTAGEIGTAIHVESGGNITVSGGNVSATGSDGNAIYMEGGGTVTVSGGMIAAESEANAINGSDGSLNMTGGTVQAEEGFAVEISGDVSVSGGKVYSAEGDAINIDGSLTVSGSEWDEAAGTGTLISTGVTGSSSQAIYCLGLTVTGGTIIGCVNPGYELNLSGGRIDGGNGLALLLSGCTAHISGGTITSANTAEASAYALFSGFTPGTIFLSDVTSADAKLYLNGGTITNTAAGYPAIFNLSLKDINPESFSFTSDLYLSSAPSISGSADIWTNNAVHAGYAVDTSSYTYTGGELEIEYGGNIESGTTVAVDNITADNSDLFSITDTDYNLELNESADKLIIKEAAGIVYPYYVITEGETESDDIQVYKKTDSAGSFESFTTSADVTSAISAITTDVSAGSATLRFGLTGTDASATGTLDIGTESINLGASGAYTIKGKLTGSGSSVIDLSGASVAVNGADIENPGNGIVISNTGAGSVAVAAGTLEARHGGKVIQSTGSGNITVSGGKLQSTGGGSEVILNSGSGNIAVSGGEIDGDTVAISNYSTGSISISGGEISCVFNCIYNEGAGSISLSGGTVSSEMASTIDNEGAGRITISGTAEITSDYVWDTVYLAGGTPGETILEMTGGSVRNTCALPLGTEECPGPDFALCIGNDGAGTVEISDGTLSGGTYGVGFFNYGTGTFKISGGNISGGAYGGYNGSTGLVYLSGVDTAITGGIADIGICEPGTVFANDGGETPAYYGSHNISVYYDGTIESGTTVAISGVSDSNYSKFSLTNEGYTLTRDVDNLLITEGGSEPDTYTIAAVSDQTLTNLTAGYSSGAQEVRTITINRTGTGELTNLTVALSGTNAPSFTVTQPVSDVLNDSTASTTFIIKAVDSLPAGTYTATVTISADNMTPVAFAVTQAINSASGGGGSYTPSKTITVAETSSGLFVGSEGQIRAEANMTNAFSNSVEVKVTDSKQDASGFGLGAGNEVYPFDISLYIKGTNTKTEPKDGYAVTISLPVPEKLLSAKEKLTVAHRSDAGLVTTLESKLTQINGVWYLVFEATEFSPYALVVKNTSTYDESAGLPYYVDSDGNTVFVGFAANGKYIAPSGATVLFKKNAKSFTDIGSHWAKDYIGFVTERELFNGTGDNRFSPDTGMTRAMFATVIGRLYERSYGEIEALSDHAFTDCNYDDYYGKYVDWAAKEGIIGGYGNGKFGPDDQITREQMAAILYRFADFLGVLPGNMDTALTYPDANTISSWAQSSALYCQSTGIITGRDGGNFAPQGTATRAEVAVILERLIENVL